MNTLIHVGLALFLASTPLLSCADNCLDTSLHSHRSELRQLGTHPMDGNQVARVCMRGPSEALLVQGGAYRILQLPVYLHIGTAVGWMSRASFHRNFGAAERLSGQASPNSPVLRV